MTVLFVKAVGAACLLTRAAIGVASTARMKVTSGILCQVRSTMRRGVYDTYVVVGEAGSAL